MASNFKPYWRSRHRYPSCPSQKNSLLFEQTQETIPIYTQIKTLNILILKSNSIFSLKSPLFNSNNKLTKMGCHRGTLFTTVAIIFTIFLSSNTLQLASATRPLHGEHSFKNQALLLQSLQAGPVTPSGSSPCSHIPGTGICVSEMNYGRPLVHPPPPFPGNIIDSAADSMANEANKQDPSS